LDKIYVSTLIFISILLFSSAAGLTTVKADSIFPVLISPVHIDSPINRTYTSDSLTLNVSFSGFCFSSIQHSLTYSLDEKDMGAMQIVPHYPDYLSVQAGFTASVQLPQLSKGQHIITVYAEHSASGITQRDISTVIFNISDTIPVNELTPPVVSNFTVENKTYPFANLSANFNVDKAVMWTGYCIDKENTTISDWWNTAASARSFNFTLIGLTEGSHTLVAYAEDTFGNIGTSDNVNFVVDTTAPNVTIVSIENKTYDSANVPLNFAVNESLSRIAYSLDGKANASISGNSTLTGLPNGVHNVTVYSWDEAGNVAVSETMAFSVAVSFPTLLVADISAVATIIVVAGLLVYHKKPNAENKLCPD
jgi:hypothetical protein